MASTIKTNNITGFSGGAGSAPITLSGDTATLGGGVSMASGLTVRNITQVALASDQYLSGSTTYTTWFSPTYTNLFSGSKVLGALTFIGNAINNSNSARKYFAIEFTGSNITDIKLQRNSEGSALLSFGGYDYGGSGLQTQRMFTLFGPLLTTSAVATITANCKLGNEGSGSNEQWNVYGNNTVGETHFTWIEYK